MSNRRNAEAVTNSEVLPADQLQFDDEGGLWIARKSISKERFWPSQITQHIKWRRLKRQFRRIDGPPFLREFVLEKGNGPDPLDLRSLEVVRPGDCWWFQDQHGVWIAWETVKDGGQIKGEPLPPENLPFHGYGHRESFLKRNVVLVTRREHVRAPGGERTFVRKQELDDWSKRSPENTRSPDELNALGDDEYISDEEAEVLKHPFHELNRHCEPNPHRRRRRQPTPEPVYGKLYRCKFEEHVFQRSGTQGDVTVWRRLTRIGDLRERDRLRNNPAPEGMVQLTKQIADQYQRSLPTIVGLINQQIVRGQKSKGVKSNSRSCDMYFVDLDSLAAAPRAKLGELGKRKRFVDGKWRLPQFEFLKLLNSTKAVRSGKHRQYTALDLRHWRPIELGGDNRDCPDLNRTLECFVDDAHGPEEHASCEPAYRSKHGDNLIWYTHDDFRFIEQSIEGWSRPRPVWPAPSVEGNSVGRDAKAPVQETAPSSGPRVIQPDWQKIASEEGDARMSATEIARRFGVNTEALEGRLRRWRRNHDEGWQELDNASRNLARILYQLRAVLPVVKELHKRQTSAGQKIPDAPKPQ